MKTKLLDEFIQIALPVIESNDCELIDAEFKKEGADKILRFYVELKEGKISLDECAKINKEISDKLDETNITDEKYILEVSSPGVERPLNKEKDYIKFKGSKIDVSLYESFEGRKKFTCVLKDYQNKIFTFAIDKQSFQIPADKIGKINLHFDFDFKKELE